MGENGVMSEMWLDAEQRFKARTNQSLRLNPSKTLNDCLVEIQNRQRVEAADAAPAKVAGIDKAKQASRDVLYCLRLLGGVAAQGASMVFPPSSLCFNALALLLDVPATLHSFHGAIDGLFETLGPSLSVFRIYDRVEQFDRIELELKQTTHKLMIAFVDICALSINLRNSGRWRRLGTEVKKILMDKDSGVKEEIERFKDLIATHTMVQGTQTLKTMLETNHAVVQVLNEASETGKQIGEINMNIASLKESDDRRRADETTQRYFEIIQQRLDPDRSVTQASGERFKRLFETCVPETASFLENRHEHPNFHAWAERDDPSAHAIYSVTGGSNTGKSYIVSSVCQHLRSVYGSPSRQSPRTLVACYVFPDIVAKADLDNHPKEGGRADGRPIETALKSVALQFAEIEPSYAQRLAADCERKENIDKFLRDAKPRELWEFLGLGLPVGKTAHYILLDGLSALPEAYSESRDQLFMVFKIISVQSPSVRVLLSTRDSLSPKLKDVSFSNVDIENYTKDDIRRYIDHELKKSDVLQDADNESRALHERVRDRLALEVGGNYYKVETALKKIKAIVDSDGTEAALDQVLDESRRDEKAISNDIIRKKEETLRSEEIDELNLLLSWVAHTYSWFKVTELNAALLLYSETRSLLRLEKKLLGKYADFFEISGGLVHIAAGMGELLRTERTAPRMTDESPKFSLSITITKADMTNVQSFLWSSLQKAAQDSFGFEQIDAQQSIKKRIEINKIESHFLIVRSTFQLLAQRADERSRLLLPYLLAHLPDHLQALEKATGFDELTPEEKREIGDGIFLLFVDGDQIEMHWDSCDTLTWNVLSLEIDVFLRWLKDPSTTGHLGRLDRDWVRRITTDTNPTRALLNNIMTAVARRWLRDESWSVGRPYHWLQDHFEWIASKTIEEQGGPEVGRELDFDDEYLVEILDENSGELKPEKVSCLAVAEWCKGLLGMRETDLLWDERIAKTLFELHENAKAIEMIKSILDRHGPNFQWSELLAHSYARSKNYQEACQTMDSASEMLAQKKPLDERQLSWDYRALSTWYLDHGQRKDAADCMFRARQMLPKDHDVLGSLLDALIAAEDEAKAIEVLQESSSKSKPDQQSQFGQVIEGLAVNNRFQQFGMIRSITAKHPDLMDQAIHEIDMSISMAKIKAQTHRLGCLLLYKGLLVSEHPTSSTLHATGIDCWNECIEVVSSQPSSVSVAVASHLACAHHFDKARQLEDGEDRKKHVKRLESMAQSMGTNTNEIYAHFYLAAYHTLCNDPEKSRQTVQRFMERGFDVLSDSVASNDWYGYFMIADSSLKCGDDLNALTAFSLIPPLPTKSNVLEWILEFEDGPERRLSQELIAEATANMGRGATLRQQVYFVRTNLEQRIAKKDTTGDGDSSDAAKKVRARLDKYPLAATIPTQHVSCDNCESDWGFDCDMHVCRYCSELGFCSPCLQMLRTTGLKAPPRMSVLACGESHDWLALPLWTRESYLERLRGEVWTGGTLDHGRRVGGELTSIEAWLDGLKKQWGYVEGAKAPVEKAWAAFEENLVDD